MDLFDLRSFQPGAIATLKSSSSLNKMVKKYVRKPVIHINTQKTDSNNMTNHPDDSSSSLYLSLERSSMDGTTTDHTQYKFDEGSTGRNSIGRDSQSGSLMRSESGLSAGSLPYVITPRSAQDDLLSYTNSPVLHPPPSSQVEVRGNLIPVNYLKEGMIKTLRKHDYIERLESRKGI